MINLRKSGVVLAFFGLLGLWAAATHSWNVTPAAKAISVAIADSSAPAPLAAAAPAGKLFAPTREQKSDALKSYNAMPIYFEPNQGQSNAQVKFQAKGSGYNFFITAHETRMAIFANRTHTKDPAQVDKAVVRMSLVGANPNAKFSGEEAKISRSNYLIGNDSHVTNVPNFGKVRCEKVYPGIDVVYYGNQKQLEYDFVLEPHADPSLIQLSISGQEKAELDAVGNLVLYAGGGTMVQHKPFMYQRLANGESVAVKGSYQIAEQKNGSLNSAGSMRVGFKVEAYDKSQPLVIDPVLVYSTFFGDKPNLSSVPSDLSGDEVGTSVAIDAQGNAYVVGFTNSYEYPNVSPIEIIDTPTQHTTPLDAMINPEKYYAFVSKFNATGSTLLFSTKFGGALYVSFTGVLPSYADKATAVAVDSLGNIYITGTTNLSNFPIKNALHVYSGGIDTFLLKLDTSGQNVLFSTYLGGQKDDIATDIALDAAGYVYIVGTTTSIDLPVSHAFQSTNGGGSDAFVAKFKGDGSEQTYCTYLGGAADDGANGVAVDGSGNVYITGFTNSTNFPYASPLQVQNGGGQDAFVTKINSDGTLLVYSTYLGGSGSDTGNGIAVDNQGNAYIVGTTSSANFPTVSQTVLPVQTTLNGTSDAFVTKIDKFGGSLVYSTYFGGELDESGVKIRVDSRGAVYVIGTTSSVTSAFPIYPGTNTIQPAALHNQPLLPLASPVATGEPSYARPITQPKTVTGLSVTIPARPAVSEGFLAKFNPTGTPLVYSTYLGSGTHLFQFEAFDNLYHADSVQDGTLTLNKPALIGDIRNTNVALNGLATDNAGNAYITGSTEGSFFYTFGAYSDIAPKFPLPGEDFPAPHTVTSAISSGAHAGGTEYFPGESSTKIFVDNRDVILCKIGDSSPLIISASSLLGTKGLNLSYQIQATNAPTSFNAAGLPPGLFVNTADGTISGVPTSTGSFQVVLTATNASGTGAQLLYITISTLPPTITSSLVAFANVNTIFRYQITAINDPGVYGATNLPQGLGLDVNTGLISGTPTVPSTTNVTITATNASGVDTQILVINVLPPLPVITSASITQGVYNLLYTSVVPLYAITATNNPSQYDASGLPPGLVIDKATGKITGTAGSLGFFNVTLSATNGGGTTTALWKLSIVPPLVPGITSAGIATAIVNEPFSYTITAVNNPLSYGVLPLPLPAGLTLNNVTGVISGIPSAASVNALTLQATNSAGTGSKPFTLTIVNPAVPVITSPLSATAIANTPFEYDIQAANHPTSFSASGQPAGLTLDPLTGKITGSTAVVTPPGSPISVTIGASNAGGAGASATLALTIIAQQIPVILSASTAQGYVNIPFTYQTQANGSPTSYGAVGLPPGLTIDPVSGLVSGTPTTIVGSPFSATISATNLIGTGSATVVFTISSPSIPVFTSPTSALGNDGATFSYTIAATGSAPIVFVASNLPMGLSQINNTTIFGKPSGGVTPVLITAYNPATNPTFPGGPANPGGVAPVTFALVLNIASAPATIANTVLTATATVGTPFNYPIMTSGTSPISVSTIITAVPNPVQLPLPAATLPQGLALTGSIASGFAITGTPTPAAVTNGGPVSVYLLAANTVGGNSKTLLLTINQASPIITSSLFANGIDGSPFSYTIAATGTQVITYNAVNLPPGLSFSSNVISGTPNSSAIGLNNVTISAQNKGGTDTQTLVIQINAAPPVITSPLVASGATGVPFSYAITATGSPTIVYSIAAGPPGLSVSTNKIVGTPTTPGVYNTVVNATNPAGTDTKQVVITILPAPPVISAAVVTGFDGVPLTFTPTVTGAIPITFTSTTLPAGLSIDPNTGIVSGTPTAPGTYPVTITGLNAGGTGSQIITFTINPSPPTITGALLVQAAPGIAFSYTITASGTPAISFQVGNLASAAGLVFSSTTNTISGVPAGPVGQVPITLIATNPYGKDVKVLVINIAITPPTLTNALSVNGQDGKAFSFFLTASGSPIIVFSATPLPAGLALNPATGEIKGTPTAVGSTAVAIGASNTFGAAPGKTLTINIAASPPVITSLLTATGGIGAPFAYNITATGTAPIAFAATGLPLGLSVDSSSGLISGVPIAAGTTVVTISATNKAGADTQKLSITISTRPPLITSPLSAAASLTLPFTYVITATGQPVITFTATNLPPGLFFSNNTISGQATLAGVYNVTLTATNDAGTDTRTLVITVSDDSDGDGFPDDLELFLGTDPFNPNSNGFINGKGSFGVLNIVSMKVKLNFKGGADSIQVKGSLPLPGGFNPSGQQAVLYVSGIAAKVGVNVKGSSRGSTSLQLKNGIGGAGFSFTFNGNFKVKLAAAGFTNDDVVLPRTVSTVVLVLLNNTLYRSDKVLTYTARRGKSGSAKQSN